MKQWSDTQSKKKTLFLHFELYPSYFFSSQCEIIHSAKGKERNISRNNTLSINQKKVPEIVHEVKGKNLLCVYFPLL